MLVALLYTDIGAYPLYEPNVGYNNAMLVLISQYTVVAHSQLLQGLLDAGGLLRGYVEPHGIGAIYLYAALYAPDKRRCLQSKLGTEHVHALVRHGAEGASGYGVALAELRGCAHPRLTTGYNTPFVLSADNQRTSGLECHFIEALILGSKLGNRLIQRYALLLFIAHTHHIRLAVGSQLAHRIQMHISMLIGVQHRSVRMQTTHQQPHLLNAVKHGNHIGAGAIRVVGPRQIVIHFIPVDYAHTCFASQREH